MTERDFLSEMAHLSLSVRALREKISLRGTSFGDQPHFRGVLNPTASYFDVERR